jgi:multidrug efflux pump subunit AcrA (membrane-fusion protein)
LTEPIAPEIIVPATSLFEDSGGSGVWVVDAAAGVVRRAPVQVIRRLGDRVVVDGKLTDGERVAAAGAHSLHDGEAVKVEAGL